MSHPHHRRPARRTAIALSLAVAAFAIGNVSAAEREPVLSKVVANAMKRDLGMNDAQLAQYFNAERTAYVNEARVTKQLGDRYAGSWLERGADGNYRYVAATTGSTKAANVGGIEVRQHRYTLRQLRNAAAELDAIHAGTMQKSRLSGVHAWAVDVPNNRVVVTVAAGHALRAADFVAASSIDPDMIRFELSPYQAPTPFLNVIGGSEYQSGGGLCSIGFSVTRGATKGFATAGHCGGVGTQVRLSGTLVGSVQGQFYPSGDQAWANVRSTDTLFGQVTKYNGTVQRVLGSTVAPIGAAVCRSGRTTGWRCGTIVSYNNSANYGTGVVNGLTRSTACAGQGDSGGSWITGAGQAQGVTSGGQLPAGSSNNCGVASPITWFQPINPILSRFGLTLVLG
ncbi:S1 family peptidase [Lysobacter hankyongensis]|uniref:Alpha-lytic protease prodomain-containing protein n=1 Tax=Lysobacter hankyongensis TaxID=1176535 RepID=A0ABP9B2J3_9GAMM